MKKTNKSLIISALFAVVFTLLASGCKFNLSDSKYLNRPDVDFKDGYISVRGSYVNSKTTHISIYRQDITDPTPSEVERVALLYPAGFSKTNQTYIYYDYNIFKGRKYHYYVRFVEENGAKNRTEWSEEIMNNEAVLPSKDSVSYAYSIPEGADYTYTQSTMSLTLPSGKDFVKPTFISEAEYDVQYVPALVLQANGKVQTFKVADTTDIQLKTIIPNDFFDTEITLLGIVGQHVDYVEGSTTELKQIIWTSLAPVKVKDSKTNEYVATFTVAREHGEDGYDYGIESDNEN